MISQLLKSLKSKNRKIAENRRKLCLKKKLGFLGPIGPSPPGGGEGDLRIPKFIFDTSKIICTRNNWY